MTRKLLHRHSGHVSENVDVEYVKSTFCVWAKDKSVLLWVIPQPCI